MSERAPITAVLFDVDDLLADTESLHCRAYCTTLGEVGVSLDEADYAEHWIRHGRGILDFCRDHNLSHEPETLRRRKAELYQALLVTDLRPMPGALDLLARLRPRYKLAAATSAYADAAWGVLRGLHIADTFDAVVTGSDVRRAKPDPEIFLRAAAALGVAPEACLVLEDAEKGVRAARAAGMRVIAVPSRLTRDNDFSLATRVVGSLADVTIELIESL